MNFCFGRYGCRHEEDFESEGQHHSNPCPKKLFILVQDALCPEDNILSHIESLHHLSQKLFCPLLASLDLFHCAFLFELQVGEGAGGDHGGTYLHLHCRQREEENILLSFLSLPDIIILTALLLSCVALHGCACSV